MAQGFMGIFGVRPKPSKTQLLPKILKEHGYETVTRDLLIQGRERLRVRDLTSSFFAYSQNIDIPESFILPFFTRKVSTVIFSEGGYTLSRSQNDKTSNI